VSVAILARCWPLAGSLPPVQWIALAALADAADDDGWTWIGHARLATKIGRETRDVRRLVSSLEGAGLVARVQWAADNGRQMSSLTFVGLGAPTPPLPVERGGRVLTPLGHHAPPPRGTTPRGEEGHHAPPHSIDPPEGTVMDPSTPRARPRNEVWDALVDVLGWFPRTTNEQKRFGRACREIREAMGTAPGSPLGSEGGVATAVRLVAREHQTRWPTVTLTLESMVKHWSDLHAAATRRATAQPGRNVMLDRILDASAKR
jgi:hypothetical protein